MMRLLNKLWFRLLGTVFRAVLRCGHEHCAARRCVGTASIWRGKNII